MKFAKLFLSVRMVPTAQVEYFNPNIRGIGEKSPNFCSKQFYTMMP